MTEEREESRPGAVPEQYPPPLRDHGLLVSGGAGLYGWGAELETVFDGLAHYLSRVGRRERTRVLRFPPVLSRDVFEASEFAQSFPHLFGTVHTFQGDNRGHAALNRAMADGVDWSTATEQTGYVLTPAACYPVYPLYAGGTADAEVDVSSYCFRHEPSGAVGRLVAFRQREFVRIGAAAAVDAWVTDGRAWALSTVRALGLDARCEPATDPFFGRGAPLLASGQRDQGLKFEVIAVIGDNPVAVASCNNHRDHFGRAFGIRDGDDGVANTACVGFGQERLAFALVATHGPVLAQWPATVRGLLWD